MVHTVSAVHGTGAGIIILGIHGVSPHGDITAGMTHGTMEQTGAGTTHGITVVTGEVGMTHGIILIMAGTIHIGVTTITIMDRDMVLTALDTETYGTVQGIRPALKDCMETAHL